MTPTDEWLAGYERGCQSGYASGFADGIRVLDEAGQYLAETLHPSKAVDIVAARRRRSPCG